MRTSGKSSGGQEPPPSLPIGRATFNPATRQLARAGARIVLEPRMASVLTALLVARGELVSRDALVRQCWNGAPIGDDSINRAVAGIRRAARSVGATELRIDTVSGAGYALAIATASDSPADAAISQGWAAWRRGLPAPASEALQTLRAACTEEPGRADAWGMLALLLREAAEYADAPECERYVEECGEAAERALALAPGEPNALSALISLAPLFGDWAPRRARLLDALDRAPGHVPLAHDLAILEMTTGRPSVATPMIAELVERDPLAASFHYKRIYHLWTAGRRAEMDRCADRALQMWPLHPAIWFARLWSLAFTGRAQQAMQQLTDGNRPPIPPRAIANLEVTLAALLDPGSNTARVAAIQSNLGLASLGPAHCVAALIHLGGLGAIDEAFAVAEGYFLRRGPVAVGARKGPDEPSINDQHRRVTQMLFIPTAQSLRADARFLPLCEDMGLAAYWDAAGVRPDFLVTGG